MARSYKCLPRRWFQFAGTFAMKHERMRHEMRILWEEVADELLGH